MLMGGNDEQVVFFHHGSGANGKSVFIEALGRLAGGYRAVVSPETFTGDQQKQGQQASPDIARLVNTRFVTVEELPRGIGLKENMIKAASGGTKMVARFLQKEFFEFDPIFTTIMSANDMPSVSGTDYGIWRRLKIIPWGFTVPEADRKPFGDMMKALDAERSGILNWLLDGLMLYLSVGLTPYIPAAVKAFTEDYREERDPVGNFAESCLIAKPGHEVNASDMFKAYEKWCEANAVKPYQQTAFGLRLNALGIRKKKGRTYSYLDVKLGDVPDIADPRTPASAAGDPGWTPSD
jgi:putative DNA primase/helicase